MAFEKVKSTLADREIRKEISDIIGLLLIFGGLIFAGVQLRETVKATNLSNTLTALDTFIPIVEITNETVRYDRSEDTLVIWQTIENNNKIPISISGYALYEMGDCKFNFSKKILLNGSTDKLFHVTGLMAAPFSSSLVGLGTYLEERRFERQGDDELLILRLTRSTEVIGLRRLDQPDVYSDLGEEIIDNFGSIGITDGSFDKSSLVPLIVKRNLDGQVVDLKLADNNACTRRKNM